MYAWYMPQQGAPVVVRGVFTSVMLDRLALIQLPLA